MLRRDFLASTAALPQTMRTGGARLRAGAASTVITPPLGASLAGYFTERFSTDNHDELFAKCVVFDNGRSRAGIVLCDLCVLPPEVAAAAKERAAREAGLSEEALLIAATHTHTAPATMHLFQSQADPQYLDWLTGRIVDSVRMAVARLQPARIGFAFGREESLVFNRRFYMKPGSMPPNPFGGIDKVRMNPGIGNPDIVTEAGPVDPAVGLLVVTDDAAAPLAMVGNYSLHYVGGERGGEVSADYFGYWAAAMARHASAGPRFVAMLTNGCQGDINNIDVRKPAPKLPPYARMEQVAEALAAECARVMKQIRFSENAELAASREWVECGVRLPAPAQVEAARNALAGAVVPYRDARHVFARETLIIAREFPPTFRAEVQALRIGELFIAAVPGEPFVELGLEIRRRMKNRAVFPVGLSNGHAGYLPTVRAHEEGGYETWLAKSSFLAVDATPKIVDAMERRLDMISG
jgi:neutral ceramidase